MEELGQPKSKGLILRHDSLHPEIKETVKKLMVAHKKEGLTGESIATISVRNGLMNIIKPGEPSGRINGYLRELLKRTTTKESLLEKYAIEGKWWRNHDLEVKLNGDIYLTKQNAWTKIKRVFKRTKYNRLK